MIGRQDAGRDAETLGLLRTAKAKKQDFEGLLKKLNEIAGN